MNTVAISTIGYYFAGGVLFGSFLSSMASFLGSAMQSGESAVIFFALALVPDKVKIKAKIREEYIHD